MLAAHHIVIDREFVFLLIRFRSLGIKNFIAILRLPELLEQQISRFRRDFDFLESVGMGEGNPDAHALARFNVFYRETLVECEVALRLRESV